MSNFVEAYKCECGHIMPLYREMGGYPPPPMMPYFTFHDCCPKCGRHRDKIKKITGQWKYKKVKYGWWLFKSTEYIRDFFVESQFNN